MVLFCFKEKNKKNRRDMTPILFPFRFLLDITVDRIGALACRYSLASGMDRIHESRGKVRPEKGRGLNIIKFTPPSSAPSIDGGL